jgi:uncharacterized membrane protein
MQLALRLRRRRNLIMVLELLATICAALFAGAAVYVNLVEHPARMATGPAAALRQWRPSYHRATVMQASLAILGTLAGLAARLGGSGPAWLVGALLLGAVVPFTLIAVLPTNRRLENLDPDPDPALASSLLAKWAQLHGVRSLLSLAALVVFAVALRRPR